MRGGSAKIRFSRAGPRKFFEFDFESLENQKYLRTVRTVPKYRPEKYFRTDRKSTLVLSVHSIRVLRPYSTLVLFKKYLRTEAFGTFVCPYTVSGYSVRIGLSGENEQGVRIGPSAYVRTGNPGGSDQSDRTPPLSHTNRLAVHPPCGLARSGGMTKSQRDLLAIYITSSR